MRSIVVTHVTVVTQPAWLDEVDEALSYAIARFNRGIVEGTFCHMYRIKMLYLAHGYPVLPAQLQEMFDAGYALHAAVERAATGLPHDSVCRCMDRFRIPLPRALGG